MTVYVRNLQSVKQEIRSVLLTHPRGADLPSFLKEYKLMVGECLPFKDFEYDTPEDFIKSLTDVVSMSWFQKGGTYVLKAIADESTKHIEKLVSKQKINKSSNTLRKPNSFGIAPRFKYPATARGVSNQALMPAYIKNEVIQVTEKYANGLSLTNFLVAYNKEFGKELKFCNYGFNSLIEFLKTIPELFLKYQHGETRVFPLCDAVSQANKNKTQVKVPHINNGNMPSKIHTMMGSISASGKTVQEARSQAEISAPRKIVQETRSQTEISAPRKIVQETRSQTEISAPRKIVQETRSQTEISAPRKIVQKTRSQTEISALYETIPCVISSAVDNEMKTQFQKILKQNPNGIFASKFKEIYEVTNNCRLNFSQLGYYNLIDLFDSMPDVFIITRPPGCVDDFLLYDAKPQPVKDMHSNESNGKLDQNESIANLYPLKSYGEVKSMIPSDAVLSDESYCYQTLPPDVDLNQYVGIYVLNVSEPGMLHIQLRRVDTSIAFEYLMDELEIFYFGEHSLEYNMPDSYVLTGAACAAIWPTDGHWHRIKIISIPSPDCIVANFVDYGTTERISNTNLRFLKKEFMILPAQAIKARLSHVMPINGVSWDPKVQKQIIELTQEKPLMAQIDDKSFEGFLSLSLCDTSGPEDIHINDVLVSEGYAQYCIDKNNMQIPLSALEEPQSSDQSYCGLQDNASNLHDSVSFGNGSQENGFRHDGMSTSPSNGGMCTNVDLFPEELVTSNVDPAILHKFLSSSTFYENDNFIHQADHSFPFNDASSRSSHYHSNVNYSASESRKVIKNHVSNRNSECSDSYSDLFQDEEEVYENFCVEVNLPLKRQVKRIALTDGYPEVHMVLVDNQTFMSSGDITYLLWENDDKDCVEQRLRMKEISIPMLTLHETGNEQLFIQLKRLRVRGIKAEDIYNTTITLFPFKNVVDILNIFGHPSIAVREEIDNELRRFDPNDPFWKVPVVNEIRETHTYKENGRDKQEDRSLSNLKSTLQALKFKKQRLKNEYTNLKSPSRVEQIKNIEAQCLEIEHQIVMFQKGNTMFSGKAK